MRLINMLTATFNDDNLKKSTFYFLDDDRSMFENLEYGSTMELTIKDAKGNIVTIPFSVKRNSFLGSKNRRIYGQVLETEDDIYREIQIKLYKENPQWDTIDVFPQAPPLKI